ncbi:superfamily II helicase [Salinibacter phage M8CRM-1]|uniref:Superfamily II helicase n=1 Tax=Salinibacter phage M8CRM-1 TaxID=2681612 RepID=A0A2I6UGS1_9CAUD|nr:superfamily II helicase [Salinibacter phage M8CRM-1]AUO79116.1 superfamily II helicase [Salinibacter phage M8CRM-1]
MAYEPRDYQDEDLEKVRREYEKGNTRLLGHAATGLGKTVFATFLPKRFPELFEHGMLVIAPRREIVFQFRDDITQMYPDASVGIEMGRHRAKGREDVVVSSADTLGRMVGTRIEKFVRDYGIIVVDECHHTTEGGMNDNILSWFGQGAGLREEIEPGVKPLVVHLTATPNRTDGQSLAPFVDAVAFSRSIRFGVENGWLTDIRAYRVTEEAIGGVLNMDSYEADLIVHAYQKYCLGMKTLVFAGGLDVADEAAERFGDVGISAAYLDGETEKEDRDRILTAHKDGELDVITNYGVLTEGYNDPHLQAGILQRATKSDLLYQQIIGRFLRPSCPVDTVDTAEERKQMIAESDKPAAHIIDIVGVTEKNQIVTVPEVFGLSNELDTEGKKMIEEVMDVVDEIEEEEPERPIRDVESLEDIETAVQKVDVWSQTVYNEKLKKVSPLRWVISENVASLYLPENPSPGGYREETPMIVRLQPSEQEGLYDVVHIDVGGWVEPPRGRGYPKRASVEHKGQIPERRLKAYMKKVDRWVMENNEKVYKKVRRDFFEANEPASDKQIERLKREGVEFGQNVTALTAQTLLAHAKIEGKVEKIIEGENGDNKSQELLNQT